MATMVDDHETPGHFVVDEYQEHQSGHRDNEEARLSSSGYAGESSAGKNRQYTTDSSAAHDGHRLETGEDEVHHHEDSRSVSSSSSHHEERSHSYNSEEGSIVQHDVNFPNGVAAERRVDEHDNEDVDDDDDENSDTSSSDSSHDQSDGEDEEEEERRSVKGSDDDESKSTGDPDLAEDGSSVSSSRSSSSEGSYGNTDQKDANNVYLPLSVRSTDVHRAGAEAVHMGGMLQSTNMISHQGVRRYSFENPAFRTVLSEAASNTVYPATTTAVMSRAMHQSGGLASKFAEYTSSEAAQAYNTTSYAPATITTTTTTSTGAHGNAGISGYSYDSNYIAGATSASKTISSGSYGATTGITGYSTTSAPMTTSYTTSSSVPMSTGITGNSGVYSARHEVVGTSGNVTARDLVSGYSTSGMSPVSTAVSPAAATKSPVGGGYGPTYGTSQMTSTYSAPFTTSATTTTHVGSTGTTITGARSGTGVYYQPTIVKGSNTVTGSSVVNKYPTTSSTTTTGLSGVSTTVIGGSRTPAMPITTTMQRDVSQITRGPAMTTTSTYGGFTTGAGTTTMSKPAVTTYGGNQYSAVNRSTASTAEGVSATSGPMFGSNVASVVGTRGLAGAGLITTTATAGVPMRTGFLPATTTSTMSSTTFTGTAADAKPMYAGFSATPLPATAFMTSVPAYTTTAPVYPSATGPVYAVHRSVRSKTSRSSRSKKSSSTSSSSSCSSRSVRRSSTHSSRPAVVAPKKKRDKCFCGSRA